jgi:hypothetical protein
VITWEDNATRKFEYTRTSTTADGNVVVNLIGKITEGRYEGHNATNAITLTNLKMDEITPRCGPNGSGVSELDGTAVLSILPL